MVGGGALGAVIYLRGGLLPRPPPEGLPVLLGPLAGVLLIGFLHRPGFRGEQHRARDCRPVLLCGFKSGLRVGGGLLAPPKPVRAEPVEALRSFWGRSA